MPRLFKMIELKEGTPVQFLAVYALRWQSEWGEPKYGFVEADDADIKSEAVKVEVADEPALELTQTLAGDESDGVFWGIAEEMGEL